MYAVRVEADTVFNDRRITTVVATYPRIIHAEILTHRAFCRNASSSRAIPVKRMIREIEEDPFIPLSWGKNQRGMVMSDQEADGMACHQIWMQARDAALVAAKSLSGEQQVHKSLANRLLEPFGWITVVITATEWANFFRLRIHPDADPHINKVAQMILDAMRASEPAEKPLPMPFLLPPEQKSALGNYMRHGVSSERMAVLAKVCAARCARISYLTHDGKKNEARDLELADRLMSGSGFGHWSPFEHFAISHVGRNTNCPYRNWKTFRSTQSNENLSGHIKEYSNG